jgi:cell cycle arrest protein BUB2
MSYSLFQRYRSDHRNTSAVLTLCACTPPLDQVLQLWDFLLAFGVHLNVLCVIAQLLLMRDDVMASSRFLFYYLCVIISNVTFSTSPMKLLRTFPPLEALPVIGIAVTLVRDLPPQLYDELVKHPFEVQQS